MTVAIRMRLAASNLGFDLAKISYDSVSFSVATEDVAPTGVRFNVAGTKMFVIGEDSDSVHQYSLSTGFDLSTASYDTVSFSVATEDSQPTDLAFNADGTKMFVIGNTNDSIHQYSLSTGFNLSTASYDSVSFSVTAQESLPHAMAFNVDGTKLFVVGFNNDTVYQYSLSTGFDLSTASYDTVSFSVASEELLPRGLAFNADGTKMLVVGNGNDTVYQYSLSTGFDLSTASYDSASLSVAAQDDNPQGLTLTDDDSKMYVVGITNDTIYQYSDGS